MSSENISLFVNGGATASNLRSLARRMAGKSVSLICLGYLVDDWLQGRRLARGDISTSLGSHLDFDAEAVADYGAQVWRGYCTEGGGIDFTGRVAEIGPGDNDVVAWHLLAHGAADVHLVDRFAPTIDPERDKQTRAIACRDPAIAAMFDRAGAAPAGIHRHAGSSAEEFFASKAGSFDAILSCAVLEHLSDPIGALTTMSRALRPGGVMVHFVDLRDHFMLAGLPPLTFLTVPGPLWRRMTVNSGRPNRVGLSRYRKWLAELGLNGSITVTMLAGSDTRHELASADDAPEPARSAAFAEVARVRPKLTRALRHETSADLAAASIALVVRRPE